MSKVLKYWGISALLILVFLMGYHIGELRTQVAMYELQVVSLEGEVAALNNNNRLLSDELYAVSYELNREREDNRAMWHTLRRLQDAIYSAPGWFKNMDITIPSLLSVEDMQLMLYGTPLEGLEEVLVEVEEEHEVNAIVIVALINHETGFMRSVLSGPPWNNLFGWGAYDADPARYAWKFESPEECIRVVVPLIKQQYIEQRGLTTLSRAGPRYASDPYWADKVSHHVALASRGVFERSEL